MTQKELLENCVTAIINLGEASKAANNQIAQLTARVRELEDNTAKLVFIISELTEEQDTNVYH